MREILFRGKRIDNDEWACGSFCMDAIELKNGPCGVDGFIRLFDFHMGKMQMHEVDRETVGQFIGLTDKNGKKIFEGDLIKADNGDGISKDSPLIVSKPDFYAGFTSGRIIDGEYIENNVLNQYIASQMIVVGNIHENPELLEG